jgi:hypothetical protein
MLFIASFGYIRKAKTVDRNITVKKYILLCKKTGKSESWFS